MATEYISRDYAVENMGNFPWDTEHDKNAAIHLVRELVPAADVRAVQVCPKCGEEHVWIDYRPAFCECCGADMRNMVEIDQVKEDAE